MKYTMDTAVDALDRANPVPDPQSLADAMARASVFLATERTDTMDTKEQTATKQPSPNRNRGLIAAIAAFAVVVLLGAISLVALNANSQEVAAGDTPQDTVDAFIAARNAGDVETSLELLAEGAVINEDNQATDEQSYADMVAWLGALGWEWEIVECEETAVSANETRLSCSYEHNNAWGRALGVGPFNDGGSLDFTVEGGEITSFTHYWLNTTFSPQVWEVFGDWMLKNHVELSNVILSDGCCTPIRTSAAVTVWRTLTEEYVAELEG